MTEWLDEAREAAVGLKRLAEKYAATDPQAKSLLKELTPVFAEIERGLVTEPYEWKSNPGWYYFCYHASSLDNYMDL